MATADASFTALVRAIAGSDDVTARRQISRLPALARARATEGATRRTAKAYYFEEIEHYVDAGDTALHVAAAAYRQVIVRTLIAMNADVRARNRRGAEPLHYAADGIPGSHTWNPRAQAATITALIDAGADPNAVDQGGVTPLHRAVDREVGRQSSTVPGGCPLSKGRLGNATERDTMLRTRTMLALGGTTVHIGQREVGRR